MEKSYWLERQSTSRDQAQAAECIEARCIHSELAHRYGIKAAFCDHEGGESSLKEIGNSGADDGTSTKLARAGERRWTVQEEAVVQMLLADGESCSAVASRARRSRIAIETRQPAAVSL